MATRRQDLICDILNDYGESNDHSLRKKAWDRANGEAPPRTLTAWEWEQWYAEHGIPESHRQPAEEPHELPFWRRFLQRIKNRTKP